MAANNKPTKHTKTKQTRRKRRTYTDQEKEHAIAVYTTCGNLSRTYRETGVPISTLRGWLAEQPAEEIQQARLDAKGRFVEAAWETIAKGLQTGNTLMSFALENKGRIDEAVKAVLSGNIDEKDKTALIKALVSLSNFNLRDISTYIGTIYDKIALATGEPTSIAEQQGQVTQRHEYDITHKIEEYADVYTKLAARRGVFAGSDASDNPGESLDTPRADP